MALGVSSKIAFNRLIIIALAVIILDGFAVQTQAYGLLPLGKQITNTVTTVTTTVAPVQNATISTVTAVQNTTSTATSSTQSTVTSTVQAVQNTTSSTTSVQGTVEDAVASVQNATSSTTSPIQSTVASTVEAVQNTTESAVSPIQDTIASTAADVQNTTSSAAPSIQNTTTFTPSIEQNVTVLQNIVTEDATSPLNILSEIADLVNSTLDTEVTDLASSVVNEETASDLANGTISEDMVNDLVSGVQDTGVVNDLLNGTVSEDMVNDLVNGTLDTDVVTSIANDTADTSILDDIVNDTVSADVVNDLVSGTVDADVANDLLNGTVNADITGLVNNALDADTVANLLNDTADTGAVADLVGNVADADVIGLVNDTLSADAITSLGNGTLGVEVTGLVNNVLDLDIAGLLNNTLNIEHLLLKPLKTDVKNVDTKIFRLLNSTDPQEQASSSGLDYYDGKVRLDVELASNDGSIISKVGTLADIELIRDNRLQINIPVDSIMTLSSMPEVKKIQPPQINVPNKDILVDGQIFEDSLFTQSAAQSNPVSVAVIDLAFDVKNPKIVNNVQESISFRKTSGQTDPIRGSAEDYLHGTAMAEIITGMAPNSKLYLLTASNELEFLDAIDYAIDKKVNVITISSTWINHDTDGTSIVTAKVEDAVRAGITVIVPSGNYAENHWEGKFSDHDGNGWNDFASNDEGMTIDVSDARVSEKKPILAYLRWDGAGASDFDLTLSDSQGNIVDYSSNMQDSSSDGSVEYIYYTPSHSGTYYLGVTCFSTCSDDRLEIFSAYDKLEYFVASGSVGVPADASGAIVVGATGNSKETKPYSSVGPTDNGIIVPNFLSPDGIITTSYGGKPFFGTSSSTAYVAGLMALLLSDHPGLQPQFVKQTLISDLTGFGGKLKEQVPVSIPVNYTKAMQSAVLANPPEAQEALDPAPVAPEEATPPVTETPTETPAVETQDTQPAATESETQTEQNSNSLAHELYQAGILSEDNRSLPIPHWYDNVVSWWHEKKISDNEFRNSINYMLDR